MDRERRREVKEELLRRADFLQWTPEEWADEVVRLRAQVEGLKAERANVVGRLRAHKSAVKRRHQKAAR